MDAWVARSQGPYSNRAYARGIRAGRDETGRFWLTLTWADGSHDLSLTYAITRN